MFRESGRSDFILYLRNIALVLFVAIAAAIGAEAQCSGGASCPVPNSGPPPGYGWDNPGELPWNGTGNGAGNPGAPNDGNAGGGENNKDWMSWPFKALTIMELINQLEPSSGGGNDSKPEPTNTPTPEPAVKPSPTPSPSPPPDSDPSPTPSQLLRHMVSF